LQEAAAPFTEYRQTVREVLERGWQTRGATRALVRAVIGHAVAFETWRSLVHHEGLDDELAAETMVRLARAMRHVTP
jgi:hypothetical protein